MEEVTTIGLDLAKRVFQVHGADAKGRPVLQKRLRRENVLSFFAMLPHCIVGMEACASSHYWAREIRNLGHDARMITASYVKPYVARQKNDAADAAAICEAVTRPAVRAAPIKTLAQQAARVVHRTHELLSRQRVLLINAIRSHMAEFGVIAAAGPQHVGSLVERISNSTTPLPDMVRAALSILADQLIALAKQINELEAQIPKHCERSRRQRDCRAISGEDLDLG